MVKYMNNPRAKVRLKIALVATVFLIAFMAIIWLLTCTALPEPPATAALRDWKPGEKEWTEQRFRYHGIDACVCDSSGCWFERDGKKCRL